MMKKTAILLLLVLFTLGCANTQTPATQEGAVQLAGISTHVAVLMGDGNVQCFGQDGDTHAYDVEDWKNVIQVDADYKLTIALLENGKVNITDSSEAVENLDVTNWKNVSQVGVGRTYAMALLEDGTVVGVSDPSTQSFVTGTDSWKNISDISVSDSHVIGLAEDGTVVTSGKFAGDVSDWSDMVAVDAGHFITVGLKSDGTVLAVANSDYCVNFPGGYSDRQELMLSRVSEWKDITMVSAGTDAIAGLKSDGTVVETRISDGSANDSTTWQNITSIQSWNGALCGIRSDGTLVGLEQYE